MSEQQKPNAKKTGLLLLVLAIGVPVVTFAIVSRNKTTAWQQEADKQLASLSTEESIKSFVEEEFASTLAPYADKTITMPDGSTYTAKTRFEYIAKKTGYSCTKTGEFVDDGDVPASSFVKCTK